MALVTGAANGIGLVTARDLARRGFSVAFADRDGAGTQAAAAAAAADAARADLTAFAVTVDVTDTASVERMIGCLPRARPGWSILL